MLKGAEFSTCHKYRYVLWRSWYENRPKAMCIGLNPSTANEELDDPTIRRLVSLLENEGYGRLYMTNLFAFISPYPDDLRSTPDPIKDNDVWLESISKICDTVIFCWGNFKQAEYRAKKIIKKFPNAMCFGKNANGSPKHPLYLKSNTSLIKYQTRHLLNFNNE